MVAVLKESNCCLCMNTWKTTVSPVHFSVFAVRFVSQIFIIRITSSAHLYALTLIGHEENRLHLDWPTRQKICVGIARGLAYLHEESTLKIVHRDIKATNVLLDKDLNAKISDFGLAKLDEEENTHISTRIAGTMSGSLYHFLLIIRS